MESAAISPYAPPETEPPPPATTARAWWLTVLGMLLLGAIGGLLGYTLMRAAGPNAPLYAVALTMLAIGGVIWLHLLVHELGHAVAGVAVGMRLYGVGIGPLRGDRAGQGWGWRYAPLRGIGGYAIALPMPDRAYGPRQHFIYLLGGPGANLLAAACALVLASQMESSALQALLVSFVLVGLALGLLNLVPLEVSGFMTDGWGLQQVLRGSPEIDSVLNALRLAGYGGAGLRPRIWPAAPVFPKAEESGPVAASNVVLRLMWALDTDNADEARRAAAALRERYPGLAPLQRPGVAAAMGSFAALIERDPVLLDAWLSRVGDAFMDLTLQRAWLEAERAALRGDPDLQVRVRNAFVALDRAQDAGTRAQIAERLEKLAAAVPS